MNIVENGKFYQYLRNKRKRTYREMIVDGEELKEKMDELVKAKCDPEDVLKSTAEKLEWYKQKEDFEEDYKLKLEKLRELGVINSRYEPN